MGGPGMTTVVIECFWVLGISKLGTFTCHLSVMHASAVPGTKHVVIESCLNEHV